MKYDGIILDIDGTVWNSTEIVAEAWNDAIKEFISVNTKNTTPIEALNKERLKSLFGKTMDIIAKELFPNLSEQNQTKLLEICDTYEKKYLIKNQKDITYPGVKETIKTLSKTHKIFIVSNCQKGYIELCLDKNNLWPYITAIECYGNTNQKKGFNIAKIIQENELKTPIYVGDTQLDLEASTENNIPFIWASYGFGKPLSYTAKITTFTELLTLLS
jgi:phosphoglycolate phosphatase